MRMIDGDALSEWLKDYGQKVIKGEREPSLMYVWKHVQDMPTIEPERKTGKWLPIIESDEFGEPYQAGVYCSECGFQSCSVDNYCSNCGARLMEGEL